MCGIASLIIVLSMLALCKKRILESYYINKSRSSDAEDIRSACLALGEIGTESAFGPLLCASEALAAKESLYCQECLDAADRVCHREGAEVLPDVLGLLRSNNVYQRELAVMFLGEVGSAGVKYLRDSLDDGEGRVRVMALASLRRIGSDAREAVNDIVRMMRIDRTAIDVFQTSTEEIFDEAILCLMSIDVMPDDAMQLLKSEGGIGTINENTVARMVYDHFLVPGSQDGW